MNVRVRDTTDPAAVVSAFALAEYKALWVFELGWSTTAPGALERDLRRLRHDDS